MTTCGEGTPDELEIHQAARPLGVRIPRPPPLLKHLQRTPFLEQVVKHALLGISWLDRRHCRLRLQLLPFRTMDDPDVGQALGSGSAGDRRRREAPGSRLAPELTGRRQSGMKAVLIIRALNEAAVVGDLVRRTPRDTIAEVIVVDNGSTDATARVARDAGAHVVNEPRRGYGAACFAGFSALPVDVGIAVFLDGDGSQRPEAIPRVVDPIQTHGPGARSARACGPSSRARRSRHTARRAIRGLAMARARHGFRAVTSHSRGSAAVSRHAGSRIWLAGGDGGQGRNGRRAYPRSPDVASTSSRRSLQGFWHPSRHRSRGLCISVRCAACCTAQVLSITPPA